MRLVSVFAFLLASLGAQSSAPVNPSSPAADIATIANLRADSNAAIAAHNVAGIVSFLADDFQITTGAGVALSGPEAMGQGFRNQFEKFPDINYVRTPELIEISSTLPLASERGRWIGRWTESGKKFEFRGTYQAMWRLTAGRWLIRAELFVTLARTETAK